MKTIKIFLASSEELDYDRMAFGNLVRRLDDMYEKRGIRIKLFEWEDYDSAYNDKRKQDEYNEYVKQSDIFLALFHKKAGKFTIEEFDKASEQFKATASPKVYTYCKDLKPGDEESPELKEFKERLFNEMGHYWCRYDNRESLQFQFVMQIQLVESNRMDDVKVEDGIVSINGLPVAKMENLKFAACNDKYQEMSKKLASFPDQIAKARLRSERYPEDEDLRDELQQLIDSHNKLKEEFCQLQNALFETAQRITSMQLEYISEKLQRAIDAFDDGNIERANTLLDEIAIEAEQHIKQLDMDRSLVHRDISALQFQAKAVMANVKVPILERIEKTISIYKKADCWAEKSALDNSRHTELLIDFGSFLGRYGFYEDATDCYQKAKNILNEELKGKESSVESYYVYATIAAIQNNLGEIYFHQDRFDEAITWYNEAKEIYDKITDAKSLSYAGILSNLGLVYQKQGNQELAFYYLEKSLSIIKQLVEDDNLKIADISNNLGLSVNMAGKYSEAIDYFSKALNIYQKKLGDIHPDTAMVINNLGLVYFNLKDYSKALTYHRNALSIRLETLGQEHHETSQSYYNIGLNLLAQKKIDEALANFEVCYNICYKINKDSLSTGISKEYVGITYLLKGDTNKGTKYLQEANTIIEKYYGKDNPETMKIKHIISLNEEEN